MNSSSLLAIIVLSMASYIHAGPYLSGSSISYPEQPSSQAYYPEQISTQVSYPEQTSTQAYYPEQISTQVYYAQPTSTQIYTSLVPQPNGVCYPNSNRNTMTNSPPYISINYPSGTTSTPYYLEMGTTYTTSSETPYTSIKYQPYTTSSPYYTEMTTSYSSSSSSSSYNTPYAPTSTSKYPTQASSLASLGAEVKWNVWMLSVIVAGIGIMF